MTRRLRLADASIRIDSMPAEGRDLVLSVPAGEREALAAQLELSSVDRLDIRLHADRFRGGFRVSGHLEAEVTQPSVVSLVPVQQGIREPIDRVFLPGGDKAYAGPAGAEVFVDLDGEDLPDHFEGQEADLTDLIVETLSLAIDSYPRAPGEEVGEIDVVDQEGEAESPFARLRDLKREDSEG
jgi:uncharacterized metal-binding protein YceD (DUF177 family)